MLQVKNLNITHRKDLKCLLQDFSCVWNDGDKAVIIGEEGDGKSTLLKWIYDPKQIEDYAEARGERMINRERLGYLPQELSGTDKDRTVYEFFLQEPAFLEQTPRELGQLAKEFHVAVDFFYGGQRMDTLSGGEKVKAQMLRLLLAQPTVLLLDEPSNDIDLETLDWLEETIRSWPHVVIFISHDETLIERTANMVIHLEQIRRKTVSRYTVAHMPYLQYRKEREDRFARQEQQAVWDRREKQIRDEKYRRIYESVDHAQRTITRRDPAGGRLLKKKMHAVKSLEKRFAREDQHMTRMPEQEDAIYFRLGDSSPRIPAGKTILDYSLEALCTPDGSRVLSRNIHLQVRGPEKVCLIGKNGAGKTTLLRKIREELQAREDLTVIYMPQNYEELLALSRTPVDYLDETGDREARTRIRTFLGAMKYTADEMDHPIRELSGGQKAKVLLLKISMSGANVLLLDEPTRNFSPLSGPVIRQMLAEFPGAIISISHDRKYMAEVCDRRYRLTEKGLEKAEQ